MAAVDRSETVNRKLIVSSWTSVEGQIIDGQMTGSAAPDYLSIIVCSTTPLGFRGFRTIDVPPMVWNLIL